MDDFPLMQCLERASSASWYVYLIKAELEPLGYCVMVLARPMRLRNESCRMETSCPIRSSAPELHKNKIPRTACSTGASWSRGILLTELIPDERIFACISVSIIPGENPKIRIPLLAVSNAIERVSIASPDLLEQ